MSNNQTGELQNTSAIGRLLEELSWEGTKITKYREGGRGFENVLTVEALQALDFLPREAFLGAVISSSVGAESTRMRLREQIESAKLTLLPGHHFLIPSANTYQAKLDVQPDALLETPEIFGVIEAKRARTSSAFQPKQLAREFVIALRDSHSRTPLLFLLLGDPPPVSVKRHGRMSIRDAISLHLETVLRTAESFDLAAQEALDMIDEVVCWTTWRTIAATVEEVQRGYSSGNQSADAAVTRLANTVCRAVEWHG